MPSLIDLLEKDPTLGLGVKLPSGDTPAPKPTQTNPTTSTPSGNPVADLVGGLEDRAKKLISDAAKLIGIDTSKRVRKTYTNPPFDPRILRLHDLTSGGNVKLVRGFIKTEPTTDVTQNSFLLSFLYNPSVVTLSHRIDQDIAAAKVGNVPTDAGRYIFPLAQSLSFDLLFDRTYDVMTGAVVADRGNVPMAQVGVYSDVIVLYDMLGITQNVALDATAGTAENYSAITGGNQGAVTITPPVGPMTMVPLRFYFGRQLSFLAHITDLTIQYTHWTQSMVPNRCTASISASLLPDNVRAASVAGAGNGSNGGAGPFLGGKENKKLSPNSPNLIHNGKKIYVPDGAKSLIGGNKRD